MPKIINLSSINTHEKYLRESIDCVVNLTYSDFEQIILDDALTNYSWQIKNNYSDGRIRAFRNDYTLDVDFPDVFLVDAIGECITIHHSDDVWDPIKLVK